MQVSFDFPETVVCFAGPFRFSCSFCVWWDYIEGGCFVWLISQVLGLTLRCRRLMEPNFRFEAQSCLFFLALDL